MKKQLKELHREEKVEGFKEKLGIIKGGINMTIYFEGTIFVGTILIVLMIITILALNKKD